MFGGLALKGSGSGSGESSKKNDDAVPAAPALPSSAFSFMVSQPTPTPAKPDRNDEQLPSPTTLASTSGFSFLMPPTESSTTTTVAGQDGMIPSPEKSTAVDDVTNAQMSTPAMSPPTSSAFSFMGNDAGAAKTEAMSNRPAPTLDAASKAKTDHENVESSNLMSSSATAFHFLQSSTNTDTLQKPPPLESVNMTSDIPSRSSSFGFMASDQTVSTIGVEDSPIPDQDLFMNTTTTTNNTMASSSAVFSSTLIGTGNGAATGAGVSFGAVSTKKTVKKRTRTAKVGAAAQQIPTTSIPDLSNNDAHRNANTKSTIPITTTATTTSLDTRTAAELAAQRAEEFLQQKIQAASQTENRSSSTPSSSNTTTVITMNHSIPLKFAASPSVHNKVDEEDAEDDAIVVAAKAAAEEAHKLQAAQSSSRGFGGLFRSRGRSPPAVTGSSHNNRRPPVANTNTAMMTMTSSNNSADTMTTTTTPPTPPTQYNTEPTETLMDRLQKEQEQSKRAMAERQLQMMQKQQQENEGTATFIPKQTTTTTSISTKSTRNTNATPVSFQNTVPDALSTLTQLPTPMEKFHLLLDEFRQQVIASMEEVTRLRNHRSGLLEERFITTAKERLAIQQRKHAETLQMVAAEQEDFEVADQMSVIIERHEQEQAEYAAILENIGRAVTELDQQKKNCVDGVTRCFQEIRKKLEAFQKEQESSDNKEASDELNRFSVTAKQLSAEHLRLQQDWKHLERDAEAVAEERSELEKAIAEQSGAHGKLRDEARARLILVEEEIEELRKQIQEKQKIAADLRTEAAGHDESVLKVRVKFSRQLNRVQKKEMTVQDNKEEWEQEKKTYDRNKEQHDVEVQSHSEAMMARDKLLEALSQEVEMADTFESIIAKEIGFDTAEDVSTSKPSSDEELAHLQANVVKCEAAVSESKAALKAVAMVLNNLEEEVKHLEVEIPRLEEAKKVAAGNRDFKAAGKASKEIKEAMARLSECKEELQSETVERKQAAEIKLGQLQQDLEEARKVATEKERESGQAAMARLADNAKRLVATKKKVCSDATERSIPGVGAYVLQAQIKALKMEGQTYGDKYGGWDLLMADIDEEEKGDEGAYDNNVVAETSDLAETETISEPAVQAIVSVETEVSNPTNDAMTPEDAKTVEEKMKRFRDVSLRLKELEDNLEAAVSAEDFDKATELDEKLKELLADVEALNLTDDEMTEAMLISEESVTTTPICSEESISPDDSARNGDGEHKDTTSEAVESENGENPAKDDTDRLKVDDGDEHKETSDNKFVESENGDNPATDAGDIPEVDNGKDDTEKIPEDSASLDLDQGQNNNAEVADDEAQTI